MRSCPAAVMLLILSMGHHSFAEDEEWKSYTMSVGELVAQCPATFGKIRPIEEGSEEQRAGLGCLIVIATLIYYLDGNNQTCSRQYDYKEHKKTYVVLLRAIGHVARTRPNTTVKGIAEPILKEQFKCK